MYQTINGWTKNKMIQYIKDNFKGKSYNEFGKCLYRGPEGKKCAAGLFIPDEKYNERMENKSAGSLVKNWSIEFPLKETAMDSLQQVHDESKEDETLNNMISWIKRNVED